MSAFGLSQNPYWQASGQAWSALGQYSHPPDALARQYALARQQAHHWLEVNNLVPVERSLIEDIAEHNNASPNAEWRIEVDPATGAWRKVKKAGA